MKKFMEMFSASFSSYHVRALWSVLPLSVLWSLSLRAPRTRVDKACMHMLEAICVNPLLGNVPLAPFHFHFYETLLTS